MVLSMLKVAGGERNDKKEAKKTCHLSPKRDSKGLPYDIAFIFYKQKVCPSATFIDENLSLL